MSGWPDREKPVNSLWRINERGEQLGRPDRQQMPNAIAIAGHRRHNTAGAGEYCAPASTRRLYRGPSPD